MRNAFAKHLVSVLNQTLQEGHEEVVTAVKKEVAKQAVLKANQLVQSDAARKVHRVASMYVQASNAVAQRAAEIKDDKK